MLNVKDDLDNKFPYAYLPYNKSHSNHISQTCVNMLYIRFDPNKIENKKYIPTRHHYMY